MSREKVHVLKIAKRPAPRESGTASRLPIRLPMDVLFLAGLAVAFALAHYSDKPPLVEQPISLERNDRPLVAEQNLIGIRVIESGLR